MSIKKIYVHVIDVASVYIPVNAKHIAGDQYKLIYDDEYAMAVNDPDYLFEFFPGDIVVVEETVLYGGSIGQLAKQLIYRAPWPDRDYLEFKFHAVLDRIPINKHAADKYRKEIERIMKEKLSGQKFYAGVLETVNKLQKL